MKKFTNLPEKALVRIRRCWRLLLPTRRTKNQDARLQPQKLLEWFHRIPIFHCGDLVNAQNFDSRTPTKSSWGLVQRCPRWAWPLVNRTLLTCSHHRNLFSKQKKVMTPETSKREPSTKESSWRNGFIKFESSIAWRSECSKFQILKLISMPNCQMPRWAWPLLGESDAADVFLFSLGFIPGHVPSGVKIDFRVYDFFSKKKEWNRQSNDVSWKREDNYLWLRNYSKDLFWEVYCDIMRA